jgi:uncharacterized repeat protein (TIGR01451 family)
MTRSITISNPTSWRIDAWRLFWICGISLLLSACRTPLQRSQHQLIPGPAADQQAAVQARISDQDRAPAVVSIQSDPLPEAATVTRTEGQVPVRQAVYQQPPAVRSSTLPPIHQTGRIPYPDAWPTNRPPSGWPADEYLLQGGDREQHVNVGRDWSVDNLDSEDAVVHYHTLEGELVIQPTNRIPIYAPRFGSVRRMDGMIQLKAQEKLAGYDRPTGLIQSDRTTGTHDLLQQEQLQHNLVARSTTTFREQTQSLGLNNRHGALEDSGRAKLSEGVGRDAWVEALNSEKPRLGASIDRPQTGLIKQQPQLTQDRITPAQKAASRGPGSLETYQLRDGKSLLEITKSSTTGAVQPGDTITFTIRFKNVGTLAVGNVTIVDHLTSRLEYVEQSQQSSMASDFFAITSSQEGSTILRWEINEPLEVGEGGEVTFECLVR